MWTELSFASQQPVKVPVGGTDVCALFSCSTVGEGSWVRAAAGTARQEALAPVAELVPTPIPLHPFPTPYTAGQHRWSPQQSGPVANLSEAEIKEALSRGCGFQLSEFWPAGTRKRFVVFWVFFPVLVVFVYLSLFYLQEGSFEALFPVTSWVFSCVIPLSFAGWN